MWVLTQHGALWLIWVEKGSAEMQKSRKISSELLSISWKSLQLFPNGALKLTTTHIWTLACIMEEKTKPEAKSRTSSKTGVFDKYHAFLKKIFNVEMKAVSELSHAFRWSNRQNKSDLLRFIEWCSVLQLSQMLILNLRDHRSSTWK